MKKTIILLTALAVFGISNLFASPGITEITEPLASIEQIDLIKSILLTNTITSDIHTSFF